MFLITTKCSVCRTVPAPAAAAALVTPSPGCVTGRPQLDLLVSLYSSTLVRNLEPNLAVELYFLAELLQVQAGDTPQIQGTYSILVKQFWHLDLNPRP